MEGLVLNVLYGSSSLSSGSQVCNSVYSFFNLNNKDLSVCI